MDKCHSDSPSLPAEIVLSPSWRNTHAGISFDEDFFFHPARRVESEQKMEKVLYEKWGQFGLGSKNPQAEPVVGAVHLASGFLVQEMAGCKVDYSESAPPQVIGAGRSELICDPAVAFRLTVRNGLRCFPDFDLKSGCATKIEFVGELNHFAVDIILEPLRQVAEGIFINLAPRRAEHVERAICRPLGQYEAADAGL